MRTKKNIVFLMENGLSSGVISKLTDNQVRVLIEKFKKETKEEQKQTVTNVTYDPNNPNDQKLLAQKGLHIDPSSKKITMTQGSEGEIKEDETDDVTSSNAQGNVELQKYTGQDAPHMANDMAPDGMDDDSDNNRSNMGMAESEIKEKFESKAQQGLFWARCNKCSDKKCKWCKMAKEFSDSTTKKEYKDMPEKKHPEKTVKNKKKETKESVQKFLEKKISEMVDNNIDAKMSKKDLIETIKKKSKQNNSMIIRRPKKVTMFSHEAPAELPIAKMFSIGKK
jgi:hypothetical protein